MTKLREPGMFICMRILFCLFALFFFGAVSLDARVDRRPACYKDLELHFFDREITSNAFSLFQIRQGGWTAMINELQSRSRDVPQMVWREGQRMQPNPLDTKYRASEAGEILGPVLFRVFHTVCKEYYITSEGVIQGMFKYIEQEQAPKIRKCFGRDTFKRKKDKEKDS